MPTQAEFGRHVGISQQAVSELVDRGVLPDAGSLDDWRLAYCAHLRMQAAGRGGDRQAGLTAARERESMLKGDLIELQIAEKGGLLVPADEVAAAWDNIVAGARSELLTLPDRVVVELRAIHGIDVDPNLIEVHVHDALARLAEADPTQSAAADPPDAAPLGAAAEAGDDAMG